MIRMRHTAAALGLLVGALACIEKGTDPATLLATTTASALEPRPVTVEKVAKRDFTRTFRATGSLMPPNQARLRALAEGPIEEIFVDIGTQVQKGQELFRTRTIDAELGVKQAQAAKAMAEARLADLRAWRRPEEVKTTEAQLARARAEYERLNAERERAQTLFERKSISPSEWDAARTAAEAAEEQVRAAEAQLQMAVTGPTREQIELAEAEVAAAEVQLEQARQGLSDTTVVAPYDGVITAKLHNPGDFVRRGDEVVEITALSVLEAEMHVPERFSGGIDLGLPVQITVESTGLTRSGVVTAVNQSIDLGTRTFLVKVEVDNSDFQIKAGSFAIGMFTLPTIEDAVAVPTESITELEGRFYVWLADNGRARRVEVLPGQAGEGYTQIHQGIEVGDLVVVQGAGALAEDDPLEITEQSA